MFIQVFFTVFIGASAFAASGDGTGWFDLDGDGKMRCGIMHNGTFEKVGRTEGYVRAGKTKCFGKPYPGTRGWYDNKKTGLPTCGIKHGSGKIEFIAPSPGFAKAGTQACFGKKYPGAPGWFDTNNTGKYSCGIKHKSGKIEALNRGEGYQASLNHGCFGINYPGIPATRLPASKKTLKKTVRKPVPASAARIPSGNTPVP